MPHTKDIYTVWEWRDAPSGLREQRPAGWDDEGEWIVLIQPGDSFPYTAFPIHNRPDLDVVQLQLDGLWYAFIRDPRSIPIPQLPDLTDFKFGQLEQGETLHGYLGIEYRIEPEAIED